MFINAKGRNLAAEELLIKVMAVRQWMFSREVAIATFVNRIEILSITMFSYRIGSG